MGSFSTTLLGRYPRLIPGVLAGSVSAFGSAVVAFAFTYISYTISGSLAVAVLVAAMQALPAPFLIRPATAIAQKYDLRLTCAIAEAAKLLLFLVVAVVVWRGDISLALLLVTSLVSGIIGALMFPAYNAHLRLIAPQGDVAALDALAGSTRAIAGIIGVLAGGLMLAAWGAAALFLVNALSYLPAVIIFLRAAPQHPTGPDSAPVSTAAVLRMVRATAALRSFVIIAICLELLAWPILNLLPKMAKDIDPSPQAFSLLLAAFYLGSALVEPVLIRRRRKFTLLMIATIALLILTAAFLLVAGNPLLPSSDIRFIVILIVLVPVGLSLSMAGTVVTAGLQSGAPDAREAEVMAVHSAAVAVLGPVGGLIVTSLAGAVGIWMVVAIEALGIGALALVLLRPRVRSQLKGVEAFNDQVLAELHAGRLVGGHGPTGEFASVQISSGSTKS